MYLSHCVACLLCVCVCVCRFLRILQLLVGEGGGGNRALLPSVIQFTMKQIYPIVSERPAPDVKAMLFELLFQILLNNWRSVAAAFLTGHTHSLPYLYYNYIYTV